MRDRRPQSEADVKAIRPRKEGENQPPRTVLGCRRQRLNAQARSRGSAGRLDCRVANIMGGKSSVIPWGIQRCQNLGVVTFPDPTLAARFRLDISEPPYSELGATPEPQIPAQPFLVHGKR